jgi:hypothetical protein
MPSYNGPYSLCRLRHGESNRVSYLLQMPSFGTTVVTNRISAQRHILCSRSIE